MKGINPSTDSSIDSIDKAFESEDRVLLGKDEDTVRSRRGKEGFH
jgi:hypothetical protein